jgi:hypothetical protein
MPNKYRKKKSWQTPKLKYKIRSGSQYNSALRRLDQIDIWVADEVLNS